MKTYFSCHFLTIHLFLSMYSLLLVDDEIRARDSIKEKIDWQNFGFSLKAEASNGIEALEVLEENKIDIVITDIQMPYMDGIEFIKKARELYPALTIIIISGYDEFTYAQTAIKYDVLEYVLKPFSAKELQEILERTKNVLDEQRANYQDKKRLEENYKKEIPSLREKFLLSLLTASNLLGSRELIDDKIKRYNININTGLKSVSLIEGSKECEDWNTTSISILQIVKDISEIQAFLLEKYIVLIHSCSYLDNENLFMKQIQRSISQIKAFCAKWEIKNFYIGLGEPVKDILLLNQSYESALHALSYCFSKNEDVFFINDITDNENSSILIEEYKKRELIEFVKSNNITGINNFLDQVFKSNQDVKSIYSINIELLESILKIAIQFNLNIFDFKFLGEKQNTIFKEVSELKSSKGAFIFFSNAFISISNQIKDLTEKSNVKFIEEAKLLINKHYKNPLFSLEDLCDLVSVSSSYFSSTFKKEVGKSFVQYLTEKRLDEAKNLLSLSNLKNYEISKEVGFSEPNYFSYCFKKHVGVSPSVFRSQNNNE